MIAVRKQEKGVYDARAKIIDYMIDNGYFKIMLDDVGASRIFQIEQSKRRANSKSILKSTKFENLITYHIALNISQKNYYNTLIKDINNLLRMVNKELNN